jgi:hypothetical protein
LADVQLAGLHLNEIAMSRGLEASPEGRERSPRARTTIGLADQIVFTLGNFLLIAVVAHFSSAQDFGAFSIAYTSYVFASELTQSGCMEALVIRYSISETIGSIKSAANAALGATLLWALSIGLSMVMAGLVMGSSAGIVVVLTGFLLPGLILQGGLRRYCLAVARPGIALINDTVWVSAQVIVLFVCVYSGRREIELLLVAWAGTGNLAAVLGLIQTQTAPKILQGVAWCKKTRLIGVSYAIEYLVLAGAAQALIYMVAMTSGLQATAGLRAGLTLFGPLNVGVIAARVVALPELVRLRVRKYGVYRTGVLWLSMCCGGLAVLSGIAAVVMPHEFGELAFGASWSLALPLVLPLTIHRTLLGLSIGPVTGMRASGSAVVSTRARASGAAVELVAGSLGALWHGAPGAAYGLAAGSATGLLLVRKAYLTSERQVENEVAPQRSPTAAEAR